mmetsp:Transcript_9501/g.14261  ORF Transcript_9501/g.14261 Transcript_9501/m.14261 type:complete len:388 (-) Transcript_9501:12-1175(-)
MESPLLILIVLVICSGSNVKTNRIPNHGRKTPEKPLKVSYELPPRVKRPSGLYATTFAESGASAGIVWEAVIRLLDNTLVETLTISITKALNAAADVEAPLVIGDMLSEVAMPNAEGWNPPENPIQKVEPPPLKMPRIDWRDIIAPKARFRESFKKSEKIQTESSEKSEKIEKKTKRGNVIPDLTKLLRFQLLETLTHSIHYLIQRPLQAGLNTVCEDRVRQPLATAIARGAGNILIPELSEQLTEAISKIVLPRLANSDFVVRKTTESLTRAITNSLAQTVLRAITHPPVLDYYCYYCRFHQLYCQECSSSLARMHVVGYYGAAYSNHFGRYYAKEYAEYSRFFTTGYVKLLDEDVYRKQWAVWEDFVSGVKYTRPTPAWGYDTAY